MTNHHLYHKHTPKLSISAAGESARKNFASLLRQCDVVNILPATPLGIVRTLYPFNVFPIPPRPYKSIKRTARRQRDRIVSILNESLPNFVVYISNYGFSPTIALPTINVIVPKLTTVLQKQGWYRD
jgi:hypothetical protein